MFETLFATLTAKIAAAGIAVAIAATGGLAGTGNLPDQAQTAVSQALNSIGVDVSLGDSAEEALELAQQAAEEALEKAQAAAEVADEDGETGEPNENSAFGQSVAADARDGGVDGQEISQRARKMAEERKAAGQANRPENAGVSADAEASVDAGPAADAGSQSQAGLETANNTPAEGRIPAFVPGGPNRPAGPPAS
ncbi:hypothetical protein BH23ACT12_BH23ACT12_23220 [soil metagenome]